MANRETSDRVSSKAAFVLALDDPFENDKLSVLFDAAHEENGDIAFREAVHNLFDDWVKNARTLAGSALSQDEHKGKRIVGKHPALAAPYGGNDYPIPSRLREIESEMRVLARKPVAGKYAKPLEDLAEQMRGVIVDLDQPSAGTSAYEMVAAAETANVEVTETLIHMVAATVLAKLIEDEGGGRANVSFSPADMDAMHQRYEIDAKRDGMTTIVRIMPRAETAPPLALVEDDGIDPAEPAEPQADSHDYARPLWAARVDGKLFPASSREQASAIVGRADVGQIAQVENRFCYHADCPAEHCNHVDNQSALMEATSDVDSPAEEA